MKLSLAIDALASSKGDMAAAVVMAAGMIFHQSPGYAVGAALATVAVWFMSRRRCPSDRVALMIFTFCAGAWGGPLLAGMDSLNWIPRPEPMLGEWEALFGFTLSGIGGAFFFAFVTRLARSSEAMAKAAADAVGKRLGIDPGNTTLPDVPKLTREEWDAMLAELPEKQREAFLAYSERAASANRKDTRARHVRDPH